MIIYSVSFTLILIQYARVAGRNEWIGTVTLRIFDAKRCKNLTTCVVQVAQTYYFITI